MTAAPLIVPAESIARRAKVTTPLSDSDRALLEDAIRDAQTDVVAYLGQPITPVTRTQPYCWPWPNGWELVYGADLIDVVSATAETDTAGAPTGYYTVIYRTGMDAATDPELEPIRRYVRAAALNSPEVVAAWQATTTASTVTGTLKSRSVSTEGQTLSETFADDTTTVLGGGGKAGSGFPGALPDITSLERWKRRSVYQAPGQRIDYVRPFGW